MYLHTESQIMMEIFFEYASATKSDSDGNYELVLEDGQYYINIYKEGYLPFAICDVTVTNNQITYLDNVILWGDSGAEVSNYIHGTVRKCTYRFCNFRCHCSVSTRLGQQKWNTCNCG